MFESGSPSELPLGSCSVAVFAPSPMVTIMVEAGSEREPDIHLHAGGQGFWVARMAAQLGAKVSLCVPLGGETGTVLGSLLAVEGVSVLSVETQAANGAYIHDRRGGSRVVIAETSSPPLTRHELDDLYGVTLAAGIESDVSLITGTRNPGILSAEAIGRSIWGDPLEGWIDGSSSRADAASQIADNYLRFIGVYTGAVAAAA